MRIDDYIKPNDEIIVTYRSLTLSSVFGCVLAVGDGEPGTREILIVAQGTTLQDHGAIGVLEHTALFTVRRGDAWVLVPGILTLAEAEAKVARNAVNERKRIAKNAPLYADQIAVTVRTAGEWIAAARRSGEQELQREHDASCQATSLRDEVRTLVTAEQYEVLVTMRERFSRGPSYGIYFWRKQLAHIEATGDPDIFVPPIALNARLSFPWLRPDALLTWTSAPGGPQQVRVLFIGSTDVLVRLTGEPIRDYDAYLIPERNVWLSPGSFSEATAGDGLPVR